MGKGSNLGHPLDDSETILKSKKKIQKEKSSEKKTMKKLSKCENSRNVQESLLRNPENLLKEEEETPKKKYECCFSVPEAEGYNWGNNNKTIYVKGFDSSLPRDGIKSALSKHFTPCGEVTRVFVPIDCETGVRLGFAFINLKDKKGDKYDIEKALALNGSDFGGRKLEVMMAVDRDDFYSYPYPNSKGCDACSVRDHRMRIYKFNSLTCGGRVMSMEYLRRLEERTWPDIYNFRCRGKDKQAMASKHN